MLTLKEKTMLGNIPSDWDSKPLKALLCEHYPGDWGEERGPHMVKVIRSTNLTKDGRLDLEDIAERSLNPKTAKLLEPDKNDILLERSGGGPDQPVGRVGFIESDMPGHAFSNFLHLLRPDTDAINPRFLGWVLWRVNQTGRILRLEQQTTQMRNLNFRDYLTMPLPVPHPEEQVAIARILDAAFKAIERIREAIDSTKRLRLGLLQSAFDFENSHEPMKNTEIGRIPISWDSVKGKNAFVLLSGGNSSVDALRLPRSLEDADAWFMKVDDFNLPDNRRRITRTKIGFKVADNSTFNILPIGTVIIAKRGAAILKNRVRITSVPIALDPNLMGIQMLPGLTADFFSYQLEWRNLSRYVESSGVPQLNNKDLYPRYFLKAPEEQQDEIVARLSAIDSYHDALIAKMEALGTLKKSLMQELLTGKVRVNSLILEGIATS